MCKCAPKKINGRFICQSKHCPHQVYGGGCKLGKVSLTCDDNECRFNKMIAPGILAARAWMFTWTLMENV